MASSNFVQNYHHRVKSFELLGLHAAGKFFIFSNVVHDVKTEYYANWLFKNFVMYTKGNVLYTKII